MNKIIFTLIVWSLSLTAPLAMAGSSQHDAVPKFEKRMDAFSVEEDKMGISGMWEKSVTVLRISRFLW